MEKQSHYWTARDIWERDHNGDDLSYLVDWRPQGGWLALKRQSDGRIDLVDNGCDDTGVTDLGDMPVAKLIDQINQWLSCVEEKNCFAKLRHFERTPEILIIHR